MRLILAFVLGISLTAIAQNAVPPVARVTDQTGTLGAEQKVALEQMLQAFETRKGSQIAVLMVRTTGGEPIEQYALRVAEQWKLGRKGVDDGALLAIAKDDRALRIEVGYGLEGALNDATAKRIIAEVITPRFREGDFFGGISAGVDRMIKVIDGEPLPAPAKSAPQVDGDVFQVLPILLIVAMVVGGLLRAVVHALAPELPLLRHAQRVLLDRLAAGGGHHQHRDLAALARLERLQHLLERDLLLRAQRAGLVGDPRDRRHRDLGIRRKGNPQDQR